MARESSNGKLRRPTSEEMVAIYGAVVATIALVWQVWSYLAAGPMLEVSASAPARVFQPRVSTTPSSIFWVSYPIALFNSGDKAITLVSGDLSFSIQPLSEADRGLASEDDAVKKLPQELFPLKLEPGEARLITVNLKLECAPGQTFQKGYSGQFAFNFETTAGHFQRSSSFLLDAVALNSRLPE